MRRPGARRPRPIVDSHPQSQPTMDGTAPFHFGIHTWGTDGDILPFFGLADGLVRAGHRVMLAVTSVDGKDYHALGQRIGAEVMMVNGPAPGRNPYALSSSGNPLLQLRSLLDACYEPVVAPMFEASMRLCTECDVVIGHALCHTLLTASQLTSVPRVAVALSPMLLPTARSSPQGRPWPAAVNRFLWWAGDHVMSAFLFQEANELRMSQGLPRVASLQRELFASDFLTLLACSPTLCPPMPDWPDHVRVTGQFAVPNGIGRPSGPLISFLEKEDPPVFMTFGSCSQFSREADLALFTEAADRAGVRAVIQMDGMEEGVNAKHPNVFICGRADHAAIFPKCAAVVHHGGAGTSHAALRAGVPSVVVAHAYDQSDWADRLHRAGVAPRPLHRARVTAVRLAEAVAFSLKNSETCGKAREMGERMMREDGVSEAVRLIIGAMQRKG